MSTVAARMREDSLRRLRNMTPGQRLTEALALGRRAVEIYASAHGVEQDVARRRFELGSQKGRRPSRVMTGILE